MTVFRARPLGAQTVIVAILVTVGLFCLYQLYQSYGTQPSNTQDVSPSGGALARSAAGTTPEEKGVPVDISAFGSDKEAALKNLGVYFSRNEAHWLRKSCDADRKFRSASITTGIGNLTFYIYDNGFVDTSVSERALHGEMFERFEIERFLLISQHLPLIDVGANVGLVALQAAIQGREVVAVEPIPENALRLCRSAVDFGHSSLVHVVNNAATSREGSVTMAMDIPRHVAHFEISRGKGWGYGATTTYGILMDRLLEVLPFKKAALKIDVESHEGHMMAGAQNLFKQVDIPMVWMEWNFVKKISGDFGPLPIMQFMKQHQMEPHELMTGRPLDWEDFMKWPFTVLWVKQGVKIE